MRRKQFQEQNILIKRLNQITKAQEAQNKYTAEKALMNLIKPQFSIFTNCPVHHKKRKKKRKA